MRIIKRLLLVLIIAVVAVVSLLFVLENQQAVALTFLGYAGPQLPVSAMLLLALLLGLAVGPVLGWFVAYRGRRRLKRSAI